MASRVPLPILPASFKKKKKHTTEDNTEGDIELTSISDIHSTSDDNDDNIIVHNTDDDNNDNNTTPTNHDENSTNDINDDENDDEDEDMTLEEHTMIVMAILKPVAVTMIIVIAIVYALNMAEAPPTKYFNFLLDLLLYLKYLFYCCYLVLHLWFIKKVLVILIVLNLEVP